MTTQHEHCQSCGDSECDGIRCLGRPRLRTPNMDAIVVEILGPDLCAKSAIAAHVRNAIAGGRDSLTAALLGLRHTLEANETLTRDAIGHLQVCSRPMVVESALCPACMKTREP